MAELEYSLEALNVRGDFFGVSAIIYVEGDDDVLFWSEVFARATDEDIEIEPVGGSEELDKYIGRIESGELRAIAARDADFLRTLGNCATDPKVVYTFGYSIENSLYVPEALQSLARSWCRTRGVTLADCQEWLAEFVTEAAPLVRLDLANAMSGSGERTLGDNCSRFMTTATSDTLCRAKIAAQALRAAPGISADSVQRAGQSLGANIQTLLLHIRGHFLASAVIKFISSTARRFGREVNISADALYAAALAHFGRLVEGKHPHKDHYLAAARAAWSAL